VKEEKKKVEPTKGKQPAPKEEKPKGNVNPNKKTAAELIDDSDDDLEDDELSGDLEGAELDDEDDDDIDDEDLFNNADGELDDDEDDDDDNELRQFLNKKKGADPKSAVKPQGKPQNKGADTHKEKQTAGGNKAAASAGGNKHAEKGGHKNNNKGANKAN